MATLMSLGGNWSTASSWALCNSTAESDSEAVSTNLTTAYQTSSTFTPGAITISGVALKISSITSQAFTTESVTVALDQGGSDVSGTVVTVLASDLQTSSGLQFANGWVFFKFASPVTLLAATLYSVKVKRTGTFTIAFYATTGANWSRQFKTTTTQAPAAGDKLIITGELTGSGTGNDLTITVSGDQTATSIGSTSFPQSIQVSKRGILSFSTAAANNPKIKWKGLLSIVGYGTVNVGSSGTPIPSGSTAELVMDPTTTTDSGIVVGAGGTLNIYGYPKQNVQAKLGADFGGYCVVNSGGLSITRKQGPAFNSIFSVGNTIVLTDVGTLNTTSSKTIATVTADTITWASGTLTAGTSYGYRPATTNQITLVAQDGSSPDLSDWATSDSIVVAATGRLSTESESVSVSSVNNTTKVVTLGSNMAYPHVSMAEVNDPLVRCSVINLTRNVKIHGASTSLCGYMVFGPLGTVVSRYAEVYYMGSGGGGKRGIDVQTTTGSADWQYGSFHDHGTSSVSWYMTSASGTTTSSLIFSYNVCYNSVTCFVTASVATTGTYTINNNIGITGGAFSIFLFNDCGGTFNYNEAVSGTTSGAPGFNFAEQSATPVSMVGNAAHSCAGVGIAISSLVSTTVSGLASWRNTSYGVVAGNGAASVATQVTFTGVNTFGNSTYNFQMVEGIGILFQNCSFASDIVFSTGYGLANGGFATSGDWTLENCTFGATSDIRTALSNIDVMVGTKQLQKIALLNCTTNTAIANNGLTGSYISAQKLNGVTGNNKLWQIGGLVTPDTTLYNSLSPSLRLTPSSSSIKLESGIPSGGGVRAAVSSGQTLTVSCKIRKSVVGDGAAYNGAEARLIVRRNLTAGISADTVLATSSGAAGSWLTLSGTTAAVTEDTVLDLIVDCDGTTGWVNVDDWSISPAVDTTGTKYWTAGSPFIASGGGSGVSRARILMG